MSGTSCDGVSAALASFEGRSFRLIAHRDFPYPSPLSRLLLRSRLLNAASLAQLNVLLGELFAQAARRLLLRAARVSARRVAVIGSHGHTVYHGPHDAIPCTLQLGEPAIIAERTGLPVIADFRPRDLAAGGEGAPLVPFFDDYFFGDGAPRALQNIGGVANVTLVGRGLRTTAFDTGPGMTLIDAAVRRLAKGRLSYDVAGRLAARGHVDRAGLVRLLAHPYFTRRPPKSTGPELFNLEWVESVMGRWWLGRGADAIATLTALTAVTIAESYRRWLPTTPREVMVSGGGARNPTLMRSLAALLAPVPVCSIESYGLPPQAKEPVAFAFLALRALRGQINHLPSTTGARAARVLGTLTPHG
jgi:anhydro-N-acetylmuramic acid kinase